MKLLLDTHAIVWWLCEPGMLSRAAYSAIGDDANEVLVSAACGYEIEIKRRRDVTLQGVPEPLHETVLAQGFGWLSISAEDAIAAARLPLHHRDPWDRILVTQAAQQSATLVTRDPFVAAYGLPTLW